MNNSSDNSKAYEAFKSIQAGGLALVPADIGYGFLGNSEKSIRKMYQLKGRTFKNPCIVAGNLNILSSIAKIEHPEILNWLADIVRLHTLAVVFPLNYDSELIQLLPNWVLAQTSENDTIAVFLNCGNFVESMVNFAFEKRMLLVGSSGNLSGTGNNYTYLDVPKSIRENVDFRYDAGTSLHQNSRKLATTILNFNSYSIRREGVNHKQILGSYNAFACEKNYKLFE